MGDSVDDILATLAIVGKGSTYEQVKEALNNYFNKRKNVVVERARFNKHAPQPREPVDTFIQQLYRMAEYCDRLQAGKT